MPPVWLTDNVSQAGGFCILKEGCVLMKFYNGCWLKKEGFETYSPAQMYEMSTENDGRSVKIYAPANYVYNRGCTLGGVLFTVRINIPVKEVFEISVSHFEGGCRDEVSFEINRNDLLPDEITCEDGYIKIVSGQAQMIIDSAMNCTFYYGKRYLTEIKSSDFMYVRENNRKDAYIRTDDVNYICAGTNLSVNEHIYGFGEKFGPFVKNGQSVYMWNEDGGTSTEQSYKCIPFYMSDRGYGVFVNNTGRVEFEVASELVRKVNFSVKGEKIKFMVICGGVAENAVDNDSFENSRVPVNSTPVNSTPVNSTPVNSTPANSTPANNALKDVITKYTALTGRPPVLPKWTFGLWLSTSFTTNYDENTVMSFIDGMFERGIPISVFHFDCFWMKGMSWCNFLWDKEFFPDPEGMLGRIKKKGVKVCVWINPYIAQNSELFCQGKEKGYFIKKNNGDVWQWDMWQSGMAVVDFTNPDAVSWYKGHLKRLLEMGVDCFKTDFGERIPVEGVKYYKDVSPEMMHNYYSYLYNQTVYDAIKEYKGEGEAVLFARSATAGGQKFPVHWGGDCTSDYVSMAESLRGGLSLMMSGFSFWSHDIGGFEDTSTEDVYKRWVAFGLLSSHSRLHGSSSYRVPWNYGDEAVDTVRTFVKLKSRLMPYIYRYAMEAHETGIPLVRSMILEYPEDRAVKDLDTQYMLGEYILVAPVFNAQSMGEVYLPEGKWYDIFDDTLYEGGRWISMKNVPYTRIPCFVKAGCVIPYGNDSVEGTFDYDMVNDIILKAYPDKASYNTSLVLYDNDLNRISYNVSVVDGNVNILS